MNIAIRVIPHEDQRYETRGDWQFDAAGNLLITVSAMGDWRWETLVGLHELVEAVLCQARGISQRAVDEFDCNFTGAGEPGAAALSPYAREHLAAEGVERVVAAELGVDWFAYEDAITGL